MEVKEVRVTLGYTHNLGNYSNVRPEICFTADLKPGDNPEEAVIVLQDKARQYVHAEIDKALEANDEPPKFYDGPRFDLITTVGEMLAAIVPSGAKLPGGWNDINVSRTDRPYDQVLRFYEKRYGEYVLLDCSGGDLSILPPLRKFYVARYVREGLRVIVLAGSDFERDKLPERWRYHAQVGGRSRLYENILAELVAEAAQNNWTFIDCTDGDYGKLAAFVAPEQAEGPAPVEPEDDDYPDTDDGLDSDDEDDDL